MNPLTELPLQASIEMDGRKVDVEISKSARQALAQRSNPLLVEMELYFSCLIRKQVRFRDATDPATAPGGHGPHRVMLSEQLQVCFRPVMTRACGKDYEGDEPPLTDFPIANGRAFVPRWLHIDYRKGQWQGEFGYARDAA